MRFPSTVILITLASFLMAGCSSFPKFKWPFGGETDSNRSGTVAEARSGAQAIDRMTEIARREQEARKTLEIKNLKFQERLSVAYSLRDKVDNDNFDKVSELNYGIYFATRDLISTDNRILIANLKSQANMNRLMPLTEDTKRKIEEDILLDVPKTAPEIQQKYQQELKEGLAATVEYEKADAQVKEAEDQLLRFREEEKRVLAKIMADQDAERARLKKEADDAVAIAKETQRKEMLGWIVKTLLIVGVIILVPGFLLKSATMIITGIGMLALSYVAATIPFWVVSTVMGIFTVSMIVVNPRSGKIDWTPWSKETTRPQSTKKRTTRSP